MTDKYAQDNSTHACAQQGGNCQANTQRLMVGEKLCFLMNTVVTLGAGPEILRTTGALHGVYEKRKIPEMLDMIISCLKTALFQVKN